MMIPKRRETGRTGTPTRWKCHQDHIQEKFLPQIHHQALEDIVTAILISGFRIRTLGRRTSLWWRFPLQLHDATGWLADHAFLTSAIAKEGQTLTFWGLRLHSNVHNSGDPWRLRRPIGHCLCIWHQWWGVPGDQWWQVSDERGVPGGLLRHLPGGGQCEESHCERPLSTLHVWQVAFELWSQVWSSLIAPEFTTTSSTRKGNRCTLAAEAQFYSTTRQFLLGFGQLGSFLKNNSCRKLYGQETLCKKTLRTGNFMPENVAVWIQP